MNQELSAIYWIIYQISKSKFIWPLDDFNEQFQYYPESKWLVAWLAEVKLKF